jgi:acylphosphatase
VYARGLERKPITMMADIARAHVWVTGRVQGVYFRQNTRREALRRGLRGWVRNLVDGRVETVIEGEKDAVEAMVAWCRHGPPDAYVDQIDVEWEEAEGNLTGFDVTW